MSLINDALKRASQSDRNRAPTIQPRAPMEPAASRPGQSSSVALGAGIVLALGLAGWCFSLWWHTGRSPAPSKVEPVAAVAPKPAPVPIVREVVAPPVAIPAPPPQVVAATPAPAPAPAPAPPAKPVEEVWPENLKVMGIFFNKINPRALISGQTVGEGEEISGIRIAKINHDSVTVEWHGQVKELVIE
jgi:hypothetical protein